MTTKLSTSASPATSSRFVPQTARSTLSARLAAAPLAAAAAALPSAWTTALEGPSLPDIFTAVIAGLVVAGVFASRLHDDDDAKTHAIAIGTVGAALGAVLPVAVWIVGHR